MPEAKYKSLERYSKNLNELAKLGKIDPVIGAMKKSGACFKSVAADQNNRYCW